MVKCQKCNGTGDVTPIEEIRRIICEGATPLYESVVIEKYPNDSLLIKFGKHTNYFGGEGGDIVVSRDIIRLRELGYEISSVGRNYLYIKTV